MSISGAGGSISAEVLPHSPYIPKLAKFPNFGGICVPLQFVLRHALREIDDEDILLRNIHIRRPNINLQVKEVNTIPSLNDIMFFNMSCNCPRRLPPFVRPDPSNPLCVILLRYFACSSINVSNVHSGFSTANTNESHEDSITYHQPTVPIERGTSNKM